MNILRTENLSKIYGTGDKLIIPVGNRMLNNEKFATNDYKREGETFEALETKTYTIVGELDISGISLFPGYIAMGYLDASDILSTDELTVYMNFKNPRKIYKELPDVAESVGLDKNEYGQYEVRYSTPLLNLYGISDEHARNKNSTGLGLTIAKEITIQLNGRIEAYYGGGKFSISVSFPKVF